MGRHPGDRPDNFFDCDEYHNLRLRDFNAQVFEGDLKKRLLLQEVSLRRKGLLLRKSY